MPREISISKEASYLYTVKRKVVLNLHWLATICFCKGALHNFTRRGNMFLRKFREKVVKYFNSVELGKKAVWSLVINFLHPPSLF